MNSGQPYRILHIVGAMNVGGTETMLMNIYRRLDRTKVQFDYLVYVDEPGHYDAEIKKLGGRIIRVSKPGSIIALLRAINDNGPYRAVHAHTLFHCGIAMSAARLAGVSRRIAHAHTTADRTDTIARRLYAAGMRFLIRRFATHELACSREAGSYLFGPGAGFDHFPNPIDYRAFQRDVSGSAARFRREAGLGGGIVIGHVGRFIEAKNHAFMLDVLQALVRMDRRAQLLLVGDGELRGQIEQAARERGLGDHVRFAGLREDIPVMMSCMDLFLFPSLHEGLGLVLLEAQAGGLPCLVSEAIQPEVDLGLDLIHRASLSDGPERWAEMIVRLVGRREADKRRIAEAFERRQYSVSGGIAKLSGLYGM